MIRAALRVASLAGQSASGARRAPAAHFAAHASTRAGEPARATLALSATELEFARALVDAKPPQTRTQKLILSLLGYSSSSSTMMRCSSAAYASINTQSTLSRWQAVGLGHDAASEYRLLALHLWMYFVRLRVEGAEGKQMMQEIFDIAFRHVEKFINEQPGVKLLYVTKFLKESQMTFYSMSFAMDEALVEDDAALAAALWRHVFESKGSAVELAAVVEYVRHQLAQLQAADRSSILGGGYTFSDISAF
eukprot:tig00000692_g3279.t1